MTLRIKLLNYIKHTLQCRSNCFKVNEDIKPIKELELVPFGESSFHIGRTRYGYLLNLILLSKVVGTGGIIGDVD